MIADNALSAPLDAGCPRCSAPDGTLILLTSITRYYACRQCGCRWQVSRIEERVSSRHRSHPELPQ
jgi:hypothetical protein